MPFLSIITPSYQQAKFLEQTIKSVITQSFNDFEYLVVDGGSDDGSVKIIKQYERQITWWVSEKDEGQGDAINKGLGRAKGEVAGWINSDDFYLPDTFRKVSEVFQQEPGLGLLYGDVLAVDENSQVFNLMQSGDYGLLDLMKFKIINQPAVFFRRRLIEEVGNLDPSYRYLLDHHLWLRIASISQIRHMPEFLAAGRYHSQAKNIAEAASFGEEAFRIVEWMAENDDLRTTFQNHEREIRAGAHQLNGYYLSEAGQWQSALRAYTACMKLDLSTGMGDWRRILFTLSQPIFGTGIKRKRYLSQLKKYDEISKKLTNSDKLRSNVE